MTTQATRDTLTTNQAIFDYGFNAILKQGKPSKQSLAPGRTPQCAYNGADDNHCIAGHLMSPEARAIGDKLTEGTSVGSVAAALERPISNLKAEGKWLEENVLLLTAMQSLHDSAAPLQINPEFWRSSYHVEVSLDKLKEWEQMSITASDIQMGYNG